MAEPKAVSVTVGRLGMPVRRFMVRGGARVVRWGRVIRSGGVAVAGLGMGVGLVVTGWTGVALAALAVHGAGVIAGTQVLVEDCAVRAVEGVLLAVSVTIMVNLEWFNVMYLHS